MIEPHYITLVRLHWNNAFSFGHRATKKKTHAVLQFAAPVDFLYCLLALTASEAWLLDYMGLASHGKEKKLKATYRGCSAPKISFAPSCGPYWG